MNKYPIPFSWFLVARTVFFNLCNVVVFCVSFVSSSTNGFSLRERFVSFWDFSRQNEYNGCSTRRERLKSALYQRLKKRKVFKLVKGGDPSGFLKFQFVAKFRQKNHTMPKKNERGDPSVSSAFAKPRKSFWLKQGLEPVTAGFTVNRVKPVLKSGTYTMIIIKKPDYYSG